MVSLPRFLYLFQNLPIYLPLKFFKQLDSLILSFIWAGKPPRISMAHLQKNTSCGGLGLPVFRHYYWAANSRALLHWQWGSPTDYCHDKLPIWLQVEAATVSEASLPVLLFSNTGSFNNSLSRNFVVKHSLKILSQIRKSLKLPDFSVRMPIIHNQVKWIGCF